MGDARSFLVAIAGVVVLAGTAPGCDGELGSRDDAGGSDERDGGGARDASGDDAGTSGDDDASIVLDDGGTPIEPDAGPACEEARTGATALGGTFRDRRPHYGARAEGHASCSYYWSESLPDFTYRSSWGTACHATRYYFLESSITSRTGWAEAVEAAFDNWDIPTLCTPHWVRTTDSTRASVRIRASTTSMCSGPGTGWYACAWSGWSITLNTGVSWGIGVSGRLDVESLVTVELAHVMHFGHSPNPADSVSLANVGRWASASMSVPSADSCDFRPYTACVPGGGCALEACPPTSEGGCGNYRTLRPGDFALAEHLAGRNPSPPHAYDDGSVPADATFHDVAMLYGSSAASPTTLFSWTGSSGALAIRPSADRWSSAGFPIDRVGDRMVAGDLDGDGRDDVATIMPRCPSPAAPDGGARVHVWTSTGRAFAYGGDAGALDLDDVDLARVAGRVVAGDFDGDGADDLALFAQDAGTGASIRVALGGDASALVDAGTWWTVDRGYDLAQVGDRVVAGDFDRDGRDDVVTAYQYPDGTFRFHVWTSTGTALRYTGASGWYTSGSFSLSRVDGRMVAGDFDRDGRDDVAMFYGTGSSATLHAWIAGDGTFTHQASPWTVASGYTLANVGDRMASGDFDRDGRDDVITAYQYADGTFRYHVWLSTGTGFGYRGAGGYYTSGPFDLANVGGRLVAGRFD